jgi:hypothetical protein
MGYTDVSVILRFQDFFGFLTGLSRRVCCSDVVTLFV